MTQAQKITKMLEVFKLLEEALFSNDRTKQIELVREARAIREGIEP